MPTEQPAGSFSPELELLFADLAQAPTPPGESGTLERRIPSASPCDLFAGIQKPSGIRTFRARFRAAAASEPFDPPAFRDLEVTVRCALDDGEERITVVLRAPSPAYNEVFTSLCQDIARQTALPVDEHEAAAAFLRRLVQWQRLLRRQRLDGLTPEQQRGLYGELYLLLQHLLPAASPGGAVAAWTGPDALAKDFEFPGGLAVEAKATLTLQPQQLQISSERQLDDAGFSSLLLYHLAVEAAHGTGETLNEAVAAIRAALTADAAASAVFEDKLLDYGYSDIHAERYRGVGYVRRAEHVYAVSDGFPRITEANLLPGVGAVRYAVSAAACSAFGVPLTSIQESVKAAQL